MSRAKMITPATAVHKHERAMHKGQPLTPMKNGGEVMRKKMNMGGPARPVAPSGAPMKKGGRACMAAGGIAKIRHNQATKAGAPKAAGKKFGNLI
jgi:hypothetical protein